MGIASPLIELPEPAQAWLRQASVRIFADGADRADMLASYRNPAIQGFTTNPTLLRKAGVEDYEAFAIDILSLIRDRPISFEVLADDLGEMETQARRIASWGDNVYVKIPVSTTGGAPTTELVSRLSREGIKLNVTALLTLEQVRVVGSALAPGPQSFVSVFAGRVADTGRDPLPLMTAAVELLRAYPKVELIWASPRELLNLIQADAIGCQVITCTRDIIAKLPLIGHDLSEYSRETVQMFRDDAVKAGFRL